MPISNFIVLFKQEILKMFVFFWDKPTKTQRSMISPNLKGSLPKDSKENPKCDGHAKV